MPELTEIDKPTASAIEIEKKNVPTESESDSDDTIPELEDAGTVEDPILDAYLIR